MRRRRPLGFGLFPAVTGYALQRNGQDYTPMFYICGMAYLLAFAAIHLLAPRLEPAPFDGDDDGDDTPGFPVGPVTPAGLNPNDVGRP